MIHRLTGATEEVNNRLRRAQTRSTLRLRATPSGDNQRYLGNNFTQRQEVYTPNKAMKVQYMFIPRIYIYFNEIPLRFQNKKEAWITWHMNQAFFCHLQEKETARPFVSNYALLIYQLCRSEGHLLERAEKQVFISKSCDD